MNYKMFYFRADGKLLAEHDKTCGGYVQSLT
jgi:hypothetical protein